MMHIHLYPFACSLVFLSNLQYLIEMSVDHAVQ